MDYKKSIDFFSKYIEEDYLIYSSNNGSFDNKSIQDLNDYKEYFFDMKEIVSDYLDYLYDNKESLKNEELEYIKKSEDLYFKIDSILEQLNKEIYKRQNSIEELFIDNSIIDIVLNSSDVSDEFKNKMRMYKGKIITEKEVDEFIDLFSLEVLKESRLNKGLFNILSTNYKMQKFKNQLKYFINKPLLSKVDISYLKNRVFKELFVMVRTKDENKNVVSKPINKARVPKNTKMVSKKDNTTSNEQQNDIEDERINNNEVQTEDNTNEVSNTQEEYYTLSYNEENDKISFPISINDLIEKGYIPKVLGARKIGDICQKVGVKIKSLNTLINEDKYNRLVIDREIVEARFYQDFMERHNQVIDEYNRLIHNYKVLLNSRLKTAYFSEDYVSNIKKIVRGLEEKRNDYQNRLKSIKYNDINSYFNIDLDNKKKIQKSTIKPDEINQELRKEYLLLEKEKKEQKESKSRKMKQNIQKRIDDTEKRIKKLQKKAIKYNASDTLLLNKNSERYIQEVQRKQLEYSIDQSIIIENSEKVVNTSKVLSSNIKEQNALKNDMTKASREDEFSLQAEYDSIENQKEKLRRELERLEKEEQKLFGSTDLIR